MLYRTERNLVIFIKHVGVGKYTCTCFWPWHHLSLRCAISLHEGAKLTPPIIISTYFQPSADKSHIFAFVICWKITESCELFESLHTVSWYKQISSCTISGPVCQPGTDTCDQWSGSCSVILWSCDLQLCLSLTGSLFRPQLLNNKRCLPQLYLYFTDKNMRMTCSLWPWQL